MNIVMLKDGTEIEADSVAKGVSFPVLHIHTHAITPVQAFEIFTPENTQEITVYDWVYSRVYSFDSKETYYERTGQESFEITQDTEVNPDKQYFVKIQQEPIVYHDFTELYAVQKSPLVDGDILVWLQRPMQPWY